jgi:hypothetical protein
VCLKVVNLAALGKRHRRGTVRAFWLYWGIDDRRFRRSEHSRRFEREQPTVYSKLVAELQLRLLPGEAELRLGGPSQLAAERARLAVMRERHVEEDRRRAAEDDAALDALI